MPETAKNKSKPEASAYLYLIFPRSVSIEELHVDRVKNSIKNAKLKTINLVIESSGGDPYSAVKIIRILRHKFDNIIGVIPSYAMSAATLMLLGANEIYMSEESQLGPLDLPIEHPTDGSRISALDVVKAFSQLGSSSTVLAIDRFQELRNPKNNMRLGKNVAAKLAFESADSLTKQVIDKLDPYHIQKGFRELRIAQWYAFDLLRTGMMKNKISQAWDTATKFVHTFPDHSYAIFKEEASETLSLTIKDSEDYPNWQKICENVETKSSGLRRALIEYKEE